MRVADGVGIYGDDKHPNGLPLKQKTCSFISFGYLLHKVGSIISFELDFILTCIFVGSGKISEEITPPPFG